MKKYIITLTKEERDALRDVHLKEHIKHRKFSMLRFFLDVIGVSIRRNGRPMKKFLNSLA